MQSGGLTRVIDLRAVRNRYYFRICLGLYSLNLRPIQQVKNAEKMSFAPQNYVKALEQAQQPPPQSRA